MREMMFCCFFLLFSIEMRSHGIATINFVKVSEEEQNRIEKKIQNHNKLTVLNMLLLAYNLFQNST